MAEGCVIVATGRKAWLIEWDSPNGKQPNNPIAGVFRPQLSGEKIREIVDIIYSTSSYSGLEMLRLMPRPSENPYAAKFATIERFGGRAPWTGQITAGHNPFLFARLVDNLREGTGTYADGSPRLEWDERSLPLSLA